MIAEPSDADALDVADTVCAAQRGDQEAFERLYTIFRPVVFGYAMKIVRNHDDAEELTQSVLVRAWQKLAQLRNPKCFGGWLHHTTYRMCMNFVTRRRLSISDEARPEGLPDHRTPSPIEILVAREDAGYVHAGLDRLAPLDRETLLAFYIRGRRIRQMSVDFAGPDGTPVPGGTIKRRLHVARNRLAEELDYPWP